MAKEHIEARAKERGLKNLKVITCDMNNFKPPEGALFDRVRRKPDPRCASAGLTSAGLTARPHRL